MKKFKLDINNDVICFFYLKLKRRSLLTSQARILNACLTNLVKHIVLEYKICVELNFICIYVLKFNFLI